jgi:hypothetical protein
MITETITAKGHENVRATHAKTFEFTAEEHLTPRGDCIVAIQADKTMGGLSEEFKGALRRDGAVLRITIECNGLTEEITAYGSKNLILTHPTDMVVRRSDFICPRTLAIRADKAAADLGRNLVQELSHGGQMSARLTVD